MLTYLLSKQRFPRGGHENGRLQQTWGNDSRFCLKTVVKPTHARRTRGLLNISRFFVKTLMNSKAEIPGRLGGVPVVAV